MGIGADIIQFFDQKKSIIKYEGEQRFIPKSIEDFIDAHPQHLYERLNIAAMCHQLVGLNFLIEVGYSRERNQYPPFNKCFTAIDVSSKDAKYGVYDFAITGFPGIYERFAPAVCPVIVIKEDGDPDIGSGFLVKGQYFVTAKHCITPMKEVRIPGWNPNKVRIHEIWVPRDPDVDLAIIEFEKKPFR